MYTVHREVLSSKVTVLMYRVVVNLNLFSIQYCKMPHNFNSPNVNIEDTKAVISVSIQYQKLSIEQHHKHFLHFTAHFTNKISAIMQRNLKCVHKSRIKITQPNNIESV